MDGKRVPLSTRVELGPLARDLPFVIRNLQALLRPEGEAIRNALNIEHGGIGILSVVWLNPGISQNDLASSLAMKKSAIAKLVKNLERKGFLSRERVHADRRMNSLTLTTQGHQFVAEMRRRTDALNAWLLDDIAPDEQDAFFRVLERIFTRLGSSLGN
jgi:DNA-binding MarR family transcriptional regulator